MTLRGLVSQAYPSPEWATFFEVSNSTGSGASRRADAVALGIWPSRGNAIIGFEFKESRGDWLRELKRPEKAEVISAQCDEWWLVAGSDRVVKAEELPSPWGLKVVNSDRTKLLTVKRAVPFERPDKTQVPRVFVAAMLRKVGEHMVLQSEVSRLVQEGITSYRDREPLALELKGARAEINALQERIKRFEHASGVEIGPWCQPERIGHAVKRVLRFDGYGRQNMDQAEASLRRSLDAILEAKASFVDDLSGASKSEG